jgi:hypothetical protein
MSILFDYDPLTGIKQHFDFDPVTEEIRLTTTQNLDAFFAEVKRKRDNPDEWKKGVKNEWAHYATIPPVYEQKLKQEGIDIYNPNQTKELINAINTRYPELKVTNAHHGFK